MGVPAFFRWLSAKYPKIVQDVLEERVKLVYDDGSMRLPFDATKPNPSGLETDNLYIDMNGIIHPCSHPENGPQPTTEAEMYENVCRYIDRLVRVVRPRKLLYLAIDGVAPRAKMNQQRSRRFRSAQEAREHAELEEHVRNELRKQGQAVPPAKKAWDSNVITPGTHFMIQLAEYVRFYIRKRMATDKAWKQLRVIFSDASIPGEGEHKIMSHIRLQRTQPGYNPNLVHVLHGLDADLIMLALATHEMHFYILREVVVFGRKGIEDMERRQRENGFQDAQRQIDELAGPSSMALPENQHKPLERISIPILREYLANEFAQCCNPQRLPFPVSLERLIDDIVFLCFFVGNDFLPHLPSLDIRDGALDFLFNVYKRVLPTLGDYITNHGGQVNLSHVDVILAEVGAIEDYVFAMKHENETKDAKRQAEMNARRKQQQGRNIEAPPVVVPASQHKVLGKAAKILEKRLKAEAARGQDSTVALQRGHLVKEEHRKNIKANRMVGDANVQAALELKKSLKPSNDDVEESSLVKHEDDEELLEPVTTSPGSKRKISDLDTGVVPTEDEAADEEADVDEVVGDDVDEVVGDDDDDDVDDDGNQDVVIPPEIDPETAKAFKEKVKTAQQKQLDDYSKSVVDTVRLHEPGWKDRYYTDKCKADDVAANGGREHLFRSYVMGLCWVMKYYYDGCPSWKWYFPFHYAPFASDLRNIERFQKDCNSFELNDPFKPIEQLMSVLPEDSSHAIPKAARWLMSDEESPIIDFYPKDVPVDPNGKAMPWLWVVLLPFIDEDRLLSALKPTMKEWTKQELLCNARGMDDGYLYIHTSHPLMEKLNDYVRNGKSTDSMKMRLTDAVAYGSGGFTGSVRMPLSNEVHSIDEAVTINPPSSATSIRWVSFDNLFLDSIDTNVAVCLSFTEPSKLSHKSVVLPGARPPRPVLTAEDFRFRHPPRLNRGGGTIANLGTSNGRSQQVGYGSMNINSYERDLAARTGRGDQMYQTGNRAWGAMEPAPKRVRQQGVPPPPPYPSNPFNQGSSHHGQGNRPGQNHPPPWQNGSGNAQRSQPYPVPQTSQAQQGRWQAPASGAQGTHQQHQYSQQGSSNQHHHQSRHSSSQQQRSNGGGYQHGPHPPPPPPPASSQPFTFQNLNRNNPPGHQPNVGHPSNRSSHPNQPPARANASVMSSLRSQLASTLQQRKSRGGGQGGR